MSEPPSFRTTQTQWARAIVEQLVVCGVRDVVASPGSRNTPLLAALERSGLRVTSCIDERVGGFFALGQARASGVPSVLVCTSGSAAAHYYPAVVEASASAVPLVVLSADRPSELQDCAAPQTVDQRRLFGVFPRHCVDLGVAEAGALASRAVRRKVAQAVEISRAPHPGPVHLNLPFRKPLEPSEVELSPPSPASHPPQAWRTEVPLPHVSPEALEPLARAIEFEPRGLIACGPALPWRSIDVQAVARLSALTGYPVHAEATSQLRRGGLGDRLLARFDVAGRRPAWRVQYAPKLVLQLGAPSTSASLAAFLDDSDEAALHVVSPWGWPDPSARATHVVRSDCASAVAALSHRLSKLRRDASWVDLQRAADDAEEVEVAKARTELTGEAAAVHEVLSRLPEDSTLVVGNSLPVREVDWFGPRVLGGVRVLSQRGANGIDGAIAATLGAATTTTQGGPTLALIGDVTFLHDVGALSQAAQVRESVAIVVLDNGGGRIFDQLPIAASRADMSPWRTAHGRDIVAIAHGFGLESCRVRGSREIGAAVSAAMARQRVSIVVADVDPVPRNWFAALSRNVGSAGVE